MMRDPDLDATIADLAPVVADIRKTEEQAVRERAEGGLLVTLHSLDAHRSDKVGILRLRADRLNMPWRSLLLVVEESTKLRRRMRRKPDQKSIFAAVEAAAADADRDTIEAHAALKFAEARFKIASSRATAAQAAVAYMRASR